MLECGKITLQENDMKKLFLITIFLVCCVAGIAFGANDDESSMNTGQTDQPKRLKYGLAEGSPDCCKTPPKCQ